MENKIKILREAATLVGRKDIQNALHEIEVKNSSKAEIILPLVGEFSSGKTTLINSLTEGKQLETATKPTTATIFEIHFGADHNYATITERDGQVKKIEDVAQLKNAELGDTAIVNVYDTSKKIPSSTVIVDTPGLSSSDPRHRQALVDFLPYADAILLVTDVNQQITRSLTDFIDTMKLSKRPIYLIITKIDTKAQSEIEAVKKYIAENTKLPISQVVCVSSKNNELDQFYTLLDEVQKNKETILKSVNTYRIRTIADDLINQIDEILSASTSEEGLDEAIQAQNFELKKLLHSINVLADNAASEIDNAERNIIRRFEDSVGNKLLSVISSNSSDYDSEAIGIINSTCSLLMADYRNQIQDILVKCANSPEMDIDLQTVKSIDLSNVEINNLSYGLNLNSAGHEYDSWIATGIQIVAAGAAIGVGGAVGGVGGALSMADTASDVGSMISNQQAVARMESVSNGNAPSQNKGMIESLVGLATEKLMGLPQRRRAISNYLDDTLVPQFKSEMISIKERVTHGFKNILESEAQELISEKQKVLKQLKEEQLHHKEEVKRKMDLLREVKQRIITM
ncbi:MAG: dynamin family protein [Muribaculaceae bacterium]|nr:dynamin family protein [Muribaculaceae bacterium]